MNDMPETIWATVNGQRTRFPAGGQSLIGGWVEHPDCGRPDRARNAYRRADLPRPQDAARIAELEAANARLRAALALLEVRAKSLVFAHHHGNGLEGWHTSVDGVDRALTVARAALAADSGAADA